MNIELTQNKLIKLQGIVEATLASPTQFEWSHPIAVHDLAKAGLIEAHPTMRHEDGKQQAYRATQLGIDHVMPQDNTANTATVENEVTPMSAAFATNQPPAAFAPPPPAAVAAPKPPTMDFEIEEGISPSAKAGKRGGRRPDVYPFAKLEVGQSFFVPATADRPEPWKAMASTVNTAMLRYSTVKIDPATNLTVQRTNRKGKVVSETVRTRTFLLEKSEKNGVVGARVFRTT